MAENNNRNIIECDKTNGTFELRGIVTATKKDEFYSEGTTKNHKPYRSINFGVEIESGKTIYIKLFGMPQEKVFFSKRDKDTKKTDTQAVDWKDRMTWKREGYRMIGVNCGVTKKLDEKGNEVNDSKILTPFDACGELRNLSDGQSVFVKGNITYSTYQGKHQINFEPNQVSLMTKPLNFEADDFVPHALFTQTIIFQNVAKSEEVENEFVISAKTVGFNSVEDCEFVTHNARLAKTFKSSVKPYNSVEVFGDIVVESHIEEVEEDDGWGVSNKMKRVSSPTVRKLMITGADKDSLDKEKYTEEIIDKALAVIAANRNAKKEYGASDDGSNASGDDWGKKKSVDYDESEDDIEF